MISVARLQQYLRESARSRYDTAEVAPFTLFFHPVRSDPHTNYAIPNEPIGGDLAQPLAALQQCFAERRRYPRFEFIQEFAPDLVTSLVALGFVEEDRNGLLICTADTYQPAPDLPGLSVTTFGSEAALDDVRALMSVQQQAFEADENPKISDAEVRQFVGWLAGTTFVLARLEGRPVGAGTLLPPIDGIAEVAGIATLAGFRRRGIAAAVTARATQAAFAQGVDTVFLTAANAAAGRVYERVGFQQYATALAYSSS